MRGGGVEFLVIVLKNWKDSSTNLFATTLPLFGAGASDPLCLCPLFALWLLGRALMPSVPHMRVPTSQRATAVGRDQDTISQEFISDEMGSVSTQDFSGDVEKSKRLLTLTLVPFITHQARRGVKLCLEVVLWEESIERDVFVCVFA